jgi:nucleotide-binding universal stress UspA family protein
MFHKILLAYDGSTGAKKALDIAIELARESHAELWALGVEEHLPHFTATVSEIEAEKEFANHSFQQCFSAAHLHALQAGVELKTVIRAGHVARTILDYAKEGRFDLLILGRSGHSGVWERFLGTTAEKVSQHAPCHVLLAS